MFSVAVVLSLEEPVFIFSSGGVLSKQNLPCDFEDSGVL